MKKTLYRTVGFEREVEWPKQYWIDGGFKTADHDLSGTVYNANLERADEAEAIYRVALAKGDK